MSSRRASVVPAPALVTLLVLLGGTPTAAPQEQTYATRLGDYAFERRSWSGWKLPARLREISGLATTRDDRLFAHGDELGIVYEIDPEEGRFRKAFALGDPTTRDDFEGIASVDDRFFLVTSAGRLYECPEGGDGERVLYNTYATGLGRRCEIEGLAFEPRDRSLLLLCKQPRDPALEGQVAIFRWSVDRRTLREGPPLRIPLDALTADLPVRSFHATGIARHPQTGSYFLVAGPEAAIAEITPEGEVLAARALPRGRHRQVEGITHRSDLALVLADEGGRRRARLTLYPTERSPDTARRTSAAPSADR